VTVGLTVRITPRSDDPEPPSSTSAPPSPLRRFDPGPLPASDALDVANVAVAVDPLPPASLEVILVVHVDGTRPGGRQTKVAALTWLEAIPGLGERHKPWEVWCDPVGRASGTPMLTGRRCLSDVNPPTVCDAPLYLPRVVV